MDTQPKGPYHIDNDEDKEGNEKSENPENDNNSEESDIKIVKIQTAGNYHSQHNSLTPQNTTAPLPSNETPKQEITNLVQDQNSQPNEINPINPVGGNMSITSSEDLEKELNEFNIRIVNLGCWELFDEQSEEYKMQVIDDNSYLVSLEAGITTGWQKYTGRNGLNIGINTFGESAPGKVVAEHFKLTPEGVADKIKHRMDIT